MTETLAESAVETAPSTAPGTDLETSKKLDGDLGRTTIADSVVSKVAGLATREVSGVHDLGGGAARMVGNVSSRVGIGDQLTQGVSVEVGTLEAAVDLVLVIDYGESIPHVTDAVRQNVVKRIKGITGLTVTEVNIIVTDLHFAGDDVSEPSESRVQ